MLVELDVFSGKPNPRWELDAPAAQALRQLLSRLKPSSRASAEPPGLGYRGFRISDAATEFHVLRGSVRTADLVYSDPELSIERYLLDQVPHELSAVHEQIKAELFGSG